MKKIEKYLAKAEDHVIPEKFEDFKNFLYSVLEKEEREYNDFAVSYAINSMVLLDQGKTPKEIDNLIWGDGSSNQITGAASIISMYHARGVEVREYFNSIMTSDPVILKEYNEKGLIFNSTFFKNGVNYPIKSN